MSYGVQWLNSSGILTVSSDSAGLAYIGQAALITSGRLATFRIYCVSRPLTFLEFNDTNSVFKIQTIQNPSYGVWDILVRNCTYSSRTNQVPVAAVTTPAVHCFTTLSGIGSGGFGIQLFDASGNRTFDSNEKMIVPKQIIDVPAYLPPSGDFGEQVYKLTAVARPAIYGDCSAVGVQRRSFSGGSTTSRAFDFSGGFRYQSTTVLERCCQTVFTAFEDIGPSPVYMEYGAETVLLIDMSDYV